MRNRIVFILKYFVPFLIAIAGSVFFFISDPTALKITKIWIYAQYIILLVILSVIVCLMILRYLKSFIDDLFGKKRAKNESDT